MSQLGNNDSLTSAYSAVLASDLTMSSRDYIMETLRNAGISSGWDICPPGFTVLVEQKNLAFASIVVEEFTRSIIGSLPARDVITPEEEKLHKLINALGCETFATAFMFARQCRDIKKTIRRGMEVDREAKDLILASSLENPVDKSKLETYQEELTALQAELRKFAGFAK